MKKHLYKWLKEDFSSVKSLLTLNIAGFLILLCIVNLQGGKKKSTIRRNFNEMEVRVYTSIKHTLHIFQLVLKMFKLLNITIKILSGLASLDTICVSS